MNDKLKVEVTSSGVSLGADIKLTEGIVVGLGGGFGWDRREATGGAKLRGNSSVAIGYASFTPRSDLFIDALFGLGSVDFKTRRPVSGMAGEATAKRGGSLTMGSLAFGIDTGDLLEWSLYGRGEWVAAKLDAYAETGAGRLSLRYDERRVESLGSVLGGRVGTTLSLGKFVVKPRFRAEWRHEFQDLDIQMLDYANVAGPSTFGIGGANWASDRLDMSIGSVFHGPDAWTFDLELGLRSDGRSQVGSARIELSKQF
ncbi:autotransporter outer membrane beta-barrel domain-containing protein [Novosphingobium sp.]|uniref:autotransporter outer membrane beta-barrel domain-containing protein n=1 Tax=Novosphingobium sp. TaxID=1874826 RepID=UPI0035B4B45F